MYAVIETGGKQYRVQPGDVIDVERLPGGGEGDEPVVFERVLLVAGDDEVRVGSPVVKEAQVQGILVGAVRGPKIVVFKMKRRKGYRRRTGHRQDLHRIRIEAISLGGETVAATETPSKGAAKPKVKRPPARKSPKKAKAKAAPAGPKKTSTPKAKSKAKSKVKESRKGAAAKAGQTKKAAKAPAKKRPAKKAKKKGKTS